MLLLRLAKTITVMTAAIMLIAALVSCSVKEKPTLLKLGVLPEDGRFCRIAVLPFHNESEYVGAGSIFSGTSYDQPTQVQEQQVENPIASPWPLLGGGSIALAEYLDNGEACIEQNPAPPWRTCLPGCMRGA